MKMKRYTVSLLTASFFLATIPFTAHADYSAGGATGSVTLDQSETDDIITDTSNANNAALKDSMVTYSDPTCGKWEYQKTSYGYNWFFILSDGTIAKNAWVRDAEKETSWYYVDINGEMQTGKYTPDNYWIPENGEYDSTLAQKADAILASRGLTREDYNNMSSEEYFKFLDTLNHDEAMIMMDFMM